MSAIKLDPKISSYYETSLKLSTVICSHVCLISDCYIIHCGYVDELKKDNVLIRVFNISFQVGFSCLKVFDYQNGEIYLG